MVQRNDNRRVESFMDEQERLTTELVVEKKHLDELSEQLTEVEALNEQDRQKIEDELAKIDLRSKVLQLALDAQRGVIDRFLLLVEEQRREKDALLEQIFKLQKSLEKKQALELKVAGLIGKCGVMQALLGE